MATETTATRARSGRVELVRALGAVALDPPPASAALCDALGLPRIGNAEHTDAFVLLAPPHATIHLGAEGKLGGEALDRVEGFWRALGATPPRDADHLGVLLMAFARLREIDEDAAAPAGAPAAAHAAKALFHEHIWSWAPGYLEALRRCCGPATAQWCDLTSRALRDEAADTEERDDLPLALRDAPPPLGPAPGRDELLDVMVTPVRSGVVLSQHDVAAAAERIGAGFRRGERRFALRAMMEQDARATLTWFAGHADAASRQHAESYGAGATGRWWRARARATGAVVDALAKGAR